MMHRANRSLKLLFSILCVLVLASCEATSLSKHAVQQSSSYNSSPFASRLPQHISPGEKMIVVDPHVHAWGAYGADGNLIRGGIASAGANWCPDLGHPCRTRPGRYRILSLGSAGCKSSIFPIPKGGAPMPYCMYFNHGEALHGSPAPEVVDGNISHGCVRMHVQDAEWLRYHFATIGTRVIIKPY